MGLWEKLFGTKHDREIKKLGPIITRIGEFGPALQKLDDAALKAKTAEFRNRIDKGQSLDDLLPEAFAVVREASGRALGMRHYDVQLIGGLTLHKGRIAEMKTGEGKTLVATLPLYLNALSGKGCHLITVNDYLADRDAEWMGRVYNFLGLSVGCILRTLTNEQRRAAYNSDITYGTNSEMGFDYLRDNMKLRLEDYVQRGHNFAIVDEVDSILIDEARTPLIISGPAEGSVDRYTEVDLSIPQLRPELDFQVDLKAKSAFLTDEGTDKIQKLLGIDNLYDPKNLESLHALNQALRAHAVYRKDVEYVVREGKVIIVDEFTGRLMPGRRWSDGLHQAIEAKEKVEIEPENRTVATITYQNFFLLYQKLAGMTGTADTEAEEFKKIYNLEVTVIPTNRPVQRKDESDLVYKTEGEKFEAVAEEIAEANKRGQPVLVGTVSVEKSEIVSRMLKRKGITHEVLNAKNHGREALIVAQAGRLGAVTIATNMAGRGTDILLGGNPEYLARERAGVDAPEELMKTELAKAKAECEEAKKKILSSGGLHIVGTERHDSRRVDNQLRGRAGRQGDPGSSRFYLSLEDSMMKAFGADRISNMMDRLGYEKGVPIEHPWLTSAIEDAQKRLEGYHFGIRKNLKEYDDVLAQQRAIFYGIRRQVLEGAGTKELVLEAIENAVFESVDATCSDRKPPREWNTSDLKDIFKKIFEEDVPLDLSRLESEKQPTDIFRDRISTHLKDVYERREEEISAELMRRLEREVLLKAMDHLWMDHLAAMDHLRDSVRLRGIGQRNPLLEYKKEGYHLFQSMYALRDEEVLTRLFRYRRANEAQIQALEEQRRAEALRQLQGFGGRPHVPGEAPGAPFRRPPPQTRLEPPAGQVPGQPGVRAPQQGMEIQLPPGFPPQLAAMLQNLPPQEAGKFLQRLVWHQNQLRNNPCWCGSGKKYKKCHMDQDLAELGPPPETPPGEGTILIPNQVGATPSKEGPAQPQLSGVVEPERDEAQAAARAAQVSDAQDKAAPIPPAPVPDITSPDLSDDDDDDGLLMIGAVKRKKK